MKKIVFLFLTFFLLGIQDIFSQVGINTTNPKTTLDVSAKRSTDGSLDGNDQIIGIQAPRITLEELTNLTSSYGADQKGALLYITDISGGNTSGSRANIDNVGYYYYDGSDWKKFSSNLDYNPILSNTISNSASITKKGRYIVPASGLSGSFIGQNNKYADYNGSTFTFTTPTNGDSVQIEEGTNIGKIFYYDGTNWSESSKTTPLATSNYNVGNSYVTNDLIIRNNKIYQANGNIPSNTAFAIGTTGATWKKVNAIADWTLTGVYEAGDIVLYNNTLFQANGNIPTNTAFTTGTTGATWKALGANNTVTYTSTVDLRATTTNPTKPSTGIIKDKITVVDRGDGWCDVMFSLGMTVTTGANAGSGIYFIQLPTGAPAIDLTEHPTVANSTATEIAVSEIAYLLPFSVGTNRNDGGAIGLGFIPHTSNSFILVQTFHMWTAGAGSKVRSGSWQVGGVANQSYQGSFRYKKQ